MEVLTWVVMLLHDDLLGAKDPLDILHDLLGGGGGHGNDEPGIHGLNKLTYSLVIRSEGGSPLGDAMCLIHHDHDADEVFTSWGIETSKRFTKAQIEDALAALDSGEYGQVLRAKGYVNGEDGWIYFDFVPGEPDLRTGAPAVTGRLCVIGCQIDEERLKTLFLG